MKTAETTDTNAVIGGLLMDLSTVATSKQSAMGLQRAAKTILALEEPIEAYLEASGSLRKIRNIGPTSERIVLEFLRGGESPTVEAAVAASEKASSVAAFRAMRRTFISRSRALAILRATGDADRQAYRGDLQVHSTWSDGSQTVREIVDTCSGRGYSYCGITDHSRGLASAGGLSPDEVIEQHREIDQINAELDGQFRLIKGIEANILADGSLDLTLEERSQFELVLAAPHTALRSPTEQTERMIAVVNAPGVHILAHPRGRVYEKRSGIRADWDAVFESAARVGIAIEIDGAPSRQDMDYELARRAVDAGCLLALDSDAHAPWEFQGAEFALAHARLAEVPSERILNCWPVEQLLEWSSERAR